VLGVDACKAGWVGILLSEEPPRALFAATIAALVSDAEADGPLAAVGVDMPIGLPDAGRRTADVLAKQEIGPLRSSVFMTPVRAALRAEDHATAVAVNAALTGEGVSQQAYALRHKLFEVEELLAGTSTRVVEVHPEVSFARMNDGPLLARKSTWAGAVVRRLLLADQGIALFGDLGAAGRSAGVDDVLDAAAAAWTARRVAAGCAAALPDPPEVFSDGRPAAIWV
jgi:predicted RNase H-like nuclease